MFLPTHPPFWLRPLAGIGAKYATLVFAGDACLFSESFGILCTKGAPPLRVVRFGADTVPVLRGSTRLPQLGKLQNPRRGFGADTVRVLRGSTRLPQLGKQ